MGFYYNSGQGPDEEEGGWRETFAIILVVFRILAKPLGILFGVILGLVLVFWLFAIHVLAGLAAVALIILAVVARGVWEARHPPEIR